MFAQQAATSAQDHYYTVSGLTVGTSYKISLEVMLPTSGAVSNINVGFYNGGVHYPTEYLAAALSASAWTEITRASLAIWANHEWMLGAFDKANYPNSSLQSQGTLYIKNFEIYSDGGLQWATSLDVTGTFSAASKSFDIAHPDPAKAAEGFHLRRPQDRPPEIPPKEREARFLRFSGALLLGRIRPGSS